MTTRGARRADACPSGEDRTAFALSALRGERREAIARHLLACAACRADADADGSLVERMRRFADLEPWEEDLAAADLEIAGRRRSRRRASLAGGLAAAAVLAALATTSRLAGERSGGAVAVDAGTPSPSRSVGSSTTAALLAAQA